MSNARPSSSTMSSSGNKSNSSSSFRVGSSSAASSEAAPSLSHSSTAMIYVRSPSTTASAATARSPTASTTVNFRGVRAVKNRYQPQRPEALRKSGSLSDVPAGITAIQPRESTRGREMTVNGMIPVGDSGAGPMYRSLSTDRSTAPVSSLSSRSAESASTPLLGSTPRTLYETLYQQKVTSRSAASNGGSGLHIPRDPHYRHYINLAGLSPSPRSTPVDPVLTAAVDDPDSDEAAEYATPRRSLTRRRSITSVELDSVGRSSIVTNVKRIFEEKSRSASVPPRSRFPSESQTDVAAERGRQLESTPRRGLPVRSASVTPSTSRTLSGTDRSSAATVQPREPLSVRYVAVVGTSKVDCNGNTRLNAAPAAAADLTVSRALNPSSSPASSSSSVSSSSLILKNETDERKMAKSYNEVVNLKQRISADLHPPVSADLNVVAQERSYVKRGWLQMQKTLPKDWQKCWCVLNSNSFTCFSDSNAESTGNFLLRVCFVQSMSVCEINLPNSFAFIILNDGNDQVFSAMTSGIRTSWIRAITKSIKESPAQSTITPTKSPALPSTTMLTNAPGGHSWKSFNGEQQTNRVEHVKERLLPAVPTSSSVPIERGRSRPGQQQLGPRSGPSMGTTIRERVVGRRVRPIKSQQNETDSYDDITPSSFSPRSTDELNSSSPSTPDLTSSHNSDTFHSSIYFQTNTASSPKEVASLYVQTRPESWQNISPRQQQPQNWKSSPSTTINNNTIVNGENSAALPVAGKSKDSIFTFLPNDNSPSPISLRQRSLSASRSKDQLWSPRQALSPSQNLLHTTGSSTSIGSDLDSFLIPDEPASSVDDFLVSSLQAEVKVLQRQLQQATQTVQSQKQQLTLQRNEQQIPDRRNSQTSTSPTARAYNYSSPLSTMNGHVSANTDAEFLREQNAKLAVELADTKRELDKQTKLLETRLAEVGSLKQELSASTLRNRELQNQLQKSELLLKTLKENAEREKRKVESELRQEHERVVTAELQLKESQQNVKNLIEEIKKKDSVVSEMKEKLVEGEKIRCQLSKDFTAQTDKKLELSKELEKCRKDLEQMRNEFDLEKLNLDLERRKSSELEADVVHLRKEQMELAASLGLETKNQLLREDLERVEARLKLLQVENSKLVLEHASCDKTINKLRKELGSTSTELRSKENMASKNVEKVESSLKELQVENSRLLKEHSNCIETIKGLQNKFDDVTSELKSKEKAAETAEKKIKAVEKETERLKESVRDSETLVKSLRSMLESVNLELQYEKDKCESQSRKAVDAEEKLKQALKKIEKMNCEIEAKDLELEMEAKNYSNYRVESQNKMKKLEDENTKLKESSVVKNDEKAVTPATQSESARHTFFGQRKESVSSIKSFQLDEVDELKKKVKELSDECQATKDELQLMTTEKEELEKSIEEAKKEIDKSSRELATAREQLRCQEIDRVVSSNPEIGKEQDWTMPEGLTELKSRYSLAVRQLRALQREAQWAESRRVDIEKANLALKRELRDMEVEREKRTGQLETKVKELGMKLEAAERRNRRLELSSKQSDNSDVSRSDTNGMNNDGENKQPSIALEPSLSNDVTGSPSSAIRIRQLESRLQTMEAEYEQQITALKTKHQTTLTQCKEETVKQLAASDISSFQIDEESIRRKYSKDTEHIKDIYDKGFGAMERSHQRTMMEMRRTHKNELDKLRQEKDQLLKEEAQATQSVLDAMRKAHEVELEKERSKFLDLLAKTYCQADMESLQRQHEEDLELIQREIFQLSEQYSVKCLENAALTERLEAQAKAMHSNCLRVHELMSRNDELSTSFKYELERLGRMVQQQSSNLSTDGEHEPKQLYMTVQLKEAEMQQLQQELTNLRRQMDINAEELQESRQMYSKLQTLMHDNNLTNGHDSMVSCLDTAETSLGHSSILQGSFGGLEPSDASLDDTALLNKLATCRRSSSNAFKILRSNYGERSMDGSTGSPRDSGRKRLSWRLKNPQRARTSPDVNSVASFRSHSADMESSCDSHDSLVTSRGSTPRCSRKSSGSESDFASTAF